MYYISQVPLSAMNTSHLTAQAIHEHIDQCLQKINEEITLASDVKIASDTQSIEKDTPTGPNNNASLRNDVGSIQLVRSPSRDNSVDDATVVFSLLNKNHRICNEDTSGNHNTCNFYSTEVINAFRRDGGLDHDDGGDDHNGSNFPLYQCIFLERIIQNDNETEKKHTEVVGFGLAYFGYSTWKGRILCLEKIFILDSCCDVMIGKIDCNGVGGSFDLETLILEAFVSIGIALDCARVVWQTFDSSKLPIYEKKLNAEVMPDWLTLQMNRTQISSFLQRSLTTHLSSISSSPPQTTINSSSRHRYNEHLTLEIIQDVISICLERHNASFKQKSSSLSPPSSSFSIRQAKDENDAKSILELVKELALYEKELDQVEVTVDIFLRDGLLPSLSPLSEKPPDEDFPLYYCLLLEDTCTTMEKSESRVVGMLFWYIGYTLGDKNSNYNDTCEQEKIGRFLYLEDLFIKEEYRGRGIGKAMMGVLADICHSLDCVKFVWQALDWNTPALRFYEKIGAVVLDGCNTIRFDREGMKNFISR